jgi:hypothetical protein
LLGSDSTNDSKSLRSHIRNTSFTLQLMNEPFKL